jgi:HD-GYP domain-containing protein (c-di-GMP phosphodiesterase class II)
LNFQESQPLDVLALGALIHDIEHAHRTLPLGTPPGKLSEEQRQIYLQHPTEGVERVRRLPFYDPTVMAIIAQHEESMDGSGFPRQITERELAPGVLCVALANRYDRAVGLEMGEPRAAVKTMLIEQMGRIPLPFLEALQGLLKSEGII